MDHQLLDIVSSRCWTLDRLRRSHAADGTPKVRAVPGPDVVGLVHDEEQLRNQQVHRAVI